MKDITETEEKLALAEEGEAYIDLSDNLEVCSHL